MKYKIGLQLAGSNFYIAVTDEGTMYIVSSINSAYSTDSKYILVKLLNRADEKYKSNVGVRALYIIGERDVTPITGS